MKIRHIIITIVTAVLLVLALQSCSLFGTSIDARIDMFVDDLNYTDRSSAYTNFHPDETSDYNALKEPTSTFDVWFDPGSFYDVYNRSESGDTVTADIDGGIYSGTEIIFYMAKDGLFDWKIESIRLGGSIIID
jgi:hypothetical protein